MPEPALCYVRNPWAWFTTAPLAEQWGDDWNDAPYDCNAGNPYTFDRHDAERGRAPWSIVKLAWEGPFDEPNEWSTNCELSVKMINAGAVPWLAVPRYGPRHDVNIPAGITLADFIRLVESVGGRIWTPLDMGSLRKPEQGGNE